MHCSDNRRLCPVSSGARPLVNALLDPIVQKSVRRKVLQQTLYASLSSLCRKKRSRRKMATISSKYLMLVVSVSLLASSCLSYRPGDFVPMSLQTQYHSMRSPWEDMLGHHCPRFGIDREVLLPIPKPTGYTGADAYKIALQIGREKFHTSWLFVVGRQSSEVPMIIIKLRYAGGDLQGVVAKVENMPHQYMTQHEAAMKQFWDVQRWPKHILVQYQWEEKSTVDVETGLYILFGSGFMLTLITALHILQSSKEKLARFVKETVVNNSLPGEEAKVE